MIVELRSIADKGNISKERLTLRVGADLDIGDFVVLQTGCADGDVTTDVYHAFWFPYQPVAKGDIVILYTRKGTASSKPLKVSGQAHFFYWNLDQTIWGGGDKAAVLLHAPAWEGKAARKLWHATTKASA